MYFENQGHPTKITMLSQCIWVPANLFLHHLRLGWVSWGGGVLFLPRNGHVLAKDIVQSGARRPEMESQLHPPWLHDSEQVSSVSSFVK